MNGLGVPILGDDFYPVLTDKPVDDFTTPLQLLATSLEFTDPVTRHTAPLREHAQPASLERPGRVGSPRHARRGLMADQHDRLARVPLIRTSAGCSTRTSRKRPRLATKCMHISMSAVVVVVLAGPDLIAHFTTTWANILTVPVRCRRPLALVRRRGLGWSELGLSPRHWRRGSRYALAAVGVVAGGRDGAALPLTRPFLMADRYATFSGAR